MGTIASGFQSGYSHERVNWVRFIDCWKVRSAGNGQKEPERWSEWDTWKKTAAKDSKHEDDVARLEARLGVALPAAYRDFLLATNGSIRRASRAKSEPRLFHSVKQVDWLRKTDPETVRAWGTARLPAVPDAQYLQYGIEQYGVGYRPEYVSHTLHVGNREGSDLILLNPKVVTADGEWEAWFLSPHIPGAIRYPSFAHLVRDLSLADITGNNEEGPYSMPKHRGTCSDLLPVNPAF